MSENPVGRPEKHTVDYFQHDCVSKDTLKMLEYRWNNNGYAFWYKLLETLGSSKDHYINLNEKGKLLLLASKANITVDVCEEMLDLLSDVEAIDPYLWLNKIVWCDNFVKRISHLYDKRINPAPYAPNEELVQELINNGKKMRK